MKKITLCLFIAISAVGCCVAQPPTAGSYVTNSHIDKFIGTWKWSSGNNEIIFKLGKFKHKVVDYDEDIILGTHSYTKNGSLVESSLDKFNGLGSNHKDRTIYASNDPTLSHYKIEGAFKDLSKHKDMDISIEYVQGSSPAQIIVNLQFKHQALTKEDQQPGNTLPMSFVLIKQ